MGDVIDFEKFRARRKRGDAETVERTSAPGRKQGKRTQLPSLPKPADPEDEMDDKPAE